MKTIVVFFIFSLVFCLPLVAFSQSFINRPLIVEVQISGKKTSDDFVKIYNPSNSEIYLGNYKGSYLRLVKRNKKSRRDYTIKSWSREPGAKIPAKSFYIWANKNYTSLPSVDTFTEQTISPDNGIALRIGPENKGKIIDALGWGEFNNVLFEKKPFPENPNQNQILKRKKINSIYQDSNNNALDFALTNSPKDLKAYSKNEFGKFDYKTERIDQSTYSSGVFINEILPSPVGKDDKEEWFELFNQNNFEVYLSGWEITDISGKTTIYKIPEGTKILAKGFLVFHRPITKITLNNDGDGLKLIQPNGNIVETVSYEKAPRGKSYSKINSHWLWSSILTPGEENSAPFLKKTEETKREKQTNIASLNKTASLNEAIGEISGSFFVYLRAFLVALFSGGAILLLKKSLKNKEIQ